MRVCVFVKGRCGLGGGGSGTYCLQQTTDDSKISIPEGKRAVGSYEGVERLSSCSEQLSPSLHCESTFAKRFRSLCSLLVAH